MSKYFRERTLLRSWQRCGQLHCRQAGLCHPLRPHPPQCPFWSKAVDRDIPLQCRSAGRPVLHHRWAGKMPAIHHRSDRTQPPQPGGASRPGNGAWSCGRSWQWRNAVHLKVNISKEQLEIAAKDLSEAYDNPKMHEIYSSIISILNYDSALIEGDMDILITNRIVK